jgi:hypothetical protein
MNKVLEAEVVEENAIVLKPVGELIEGVDIPQLIKDWEGNVPTIDITADDAKTKYKIVKKGHLAFVSARNKVEKARKALKDPALTYGKEVDAKAKSLKEMMAELEAELYTQRATYENHEKSIEQEKINAERARVDLISKKIEEMRLAPLAVMSESSMSIKQALEYLEVPTEEIFQEQLVYATDIYGTAKWQMEEALKTKQLAEDQVLINAERDEQERVRKAEEQKALDIEREALAKERAEIEAFKTEQRAKEKAEQEALDKANAEAEAELIAKQEAEDQAEEEAKAKAMKEDQEKEATSNFEDTVLDIATLINISATKAKTLLKAIEAGEIKGVRYE